MKIVRFITTLALAALPVAAAAQWPDKPIHVIVPFTAGSGTDIVARTVFEPVGRALKSYFRSPEYEAAAARARDSVSYRVVER